MLILGCSGWEENYVICCSRDREKLEKELVLWEEKVKKFKPLTDLYNKMHTDFFIEFDSLTENQKEEREKDFLFYEARDNLDKKFCDTYGFDLSELVDIVCLSTLNRFYICEIKEI